MCRLPCTVRTKTISDGGQNIGEKTRHYIGMLCNGSTTGFDPVGLGSIPSIPTIRLYSTTGQYNGLLIREMQVQILLQTPTVLLVFSDVNEKTTVPD